MPAAFQNESFEGGFSLVELMITVGIIGIIALITVPDPAPIREYNLELASSEVADAMRFARNEAMRTGEPHGFHTDSAQNRVRVFRADLGTLPPTPIYDVYHPVTRQLYDLDLDEHRLFVGVSISGSSATWRGACVSPTYIGFDATGVPRCGDPWAVSLDSGNIKVSNAISSRDIFLDGETGRVHLQ